MKRDGLLNQTYNLGTHGKKNTRSGGKYLPFRFKSLKYNNSDFPYFTRQWNMLSKEHNCLNLPDFETKMQKLSKPPKYKHLGRGNKYAFSLLTRHYILQIV